MVRKHNDHEQPNLYEIFVRYTVWLHPDTVHPPVVTARAVQGAVVQIRQAVALGDTAWLTVRAQDTTVVKRYGIRFLRSLSSVSTLSAFHYQLGEADSSVNIQDGVTTYIVWLKEKTTAVPFNFRSELTDGRAAVKYLRIPLSVNDTAVVRVLAEDGVSVTAYFFVFRRIPSADALLDSIWVNGSPLKHFRPDRFSYSCGISTAMQELPVVSVRLAWEADSVYVTQSSSLFGTAQIRVVAEDGQHYHIYTVQFRPLNTESRLQSIGLDGGFPVPHFNADVKRYEMSYGPQFPKTVEAVPVDSFATWKWEAVVHSDTMDIKVLCMAEDTNFWSLYSVRIHLVNGVGQYAETPVSVYPNPAHTMLYVRGVKGEPVRLFDMQGRLLMQAEATGEETIQMDVSGLPNGIFLLRCGRRVARFVVAR